MVLKKSEKSTFAPGPRKELFEEQGGDRGGPRSRVSVVVVAHSLEHVFTGKSGVAESGDLPERTFPVHPGQEWRGRTPGPVLPALLVTSARERGGVGTCLPVPSRRVTGQGVP